MENISGHCPVCRSTISTGRTLCPSCETPHHKECWEYNGKCAIFGCKPIVAPPIAVPTQETYLFGILGTALLVLPILGVLFVIISADRMTVPSGEVIIKSYPGIVRSLRSFDEGQTYYPFFSTITSYKKKPIFYFSTPIQFSDGIVGNMSGSVEYRMPVSLRDVELLHNIYGSQTEISQKMIWTEVHNTLLQTARIMTSVECYKDRGAKFHGLFSDQMRYGRYVVMLGDGVVIHPINGREIRIETVYPVTRPCGDYIRNTPNSKSFGISVNKASVDIGYPREFIDAMSRLEDVEIEQMRKVQETRMKRRPIRKFISTAIKCLRSLF